MKKFKPLHVERSYSQELDARPDEVFPLLCPVREYDWIETWECELVHSVSGVAELDCVFTTDLPGRGKERWLVCGYEPGERIEFAIYGPGRINHLTVSLEKIEGGRSRITWAQVFTGLDVRGNEYIAAMTPETYKINLQILNLLLNHYLVNTTMLATSEATQMLAHS